MMFADDVVLCREDKEELEVSLERWRTVFEERGLSRKKTEYLQAGGVEQGTVYIQGETVKKVDHFKYLGVVVSTDGSCGVVRYGDSGGDRKDGEKDGGS